MTSEAHIDWSSTLRPIIGICSLLVVALCHGDELGSGKLRLGTRYELPVGAAGAVPSMSGKLVVVPGTSLHFRYCEENGRWIKENIPVDFACDNAGGWAMGESGSECFYAKGKIYHFANGELAKVEAGDMPEAATGMMELLNMLNRPPKTPVALPSNELAQLNYQYYETGHVAQGEEPSLQVLPSENRTEALCLSVSTRHARLKARQFVYSSRTERVTALDFGDRAPSDGYLNGCSGVLSGRYIVSFISFHPDDDCDESRRLVGYLQVHSFEGRLLGELSVPKSPNARESYEFGRIYLLDDSSTILCTSSHAGFLGFAKVFDD